MISSVLRTAAVVVLLTAGGVSAQTPEFANARGDWTIHSVGGRGEAATQHVQIHQGEGKIWGRFEGPNQSGGIQGSVNGRHIEFQTETRDVLHFRGQIEGDTIDGTFGNRGVQGTWRAVRNSP